MTTACLATALVLATSAGASTSPATPAAKPAAAPVATPVGEAVVASATVTATVTKIDQKTREVTVNTDDGQEYSFVAGDNVKNLAQVKAGDRITVKYAEAL